MAKRMFMYVDEVSELNAHIPADVQLASCGVHRVWSRQSAGVAGKAMILDFRYSRQLLPLESMVVSAYGGACVDGEFFTQAEVAEFVRTYKLKEACVFERQIDPVRFDLPVQPHVRLYMGNQRLLTRYKLVEKDGYLIIPVIDGYFCSVRQGEKVFIQTDSAQACGIFEAREYRAVVQDTDQWIDFNYPVPAGDK